MVTSPQRPPSRRTEGIRSGGRSATVVTKVLHAAVELLGEVGYVALRIEDVAARSGVNKTTIYRRWPTRAELVKAALQAEAKITESEPTGDIRADMINAIAARAAWFESPLGRAVKRVVQLAKAASPDDELHRIIGELRREHLTARMTDIEAAIARGQLPRGVDARLIVETAQAPVFSRILHHDERVTRDYIASVVDLVLAGVAAGAGRLA